MTRLGHMPTQQATPVVQLRAQLAFDRPRIKRARATGGLQSSDLPSKGVPLRLPVVDRLHEGLKLSASRYGGSQMRKLALDDGELRAGHLPIRSCGRRDFWRQSQHRLPYRFADHVRL